MTDIIVIGAGVSALSACASLSEAGINNFVILEANDRIGGRMHTIPFENHYIEIGCQWIHGQKENPVYDLAISLGQVDETEDNENAHYATQDGNELDHDALENLNQEIEELFDRDSIAKHLEDSPDISLGEALEKNFERRFDKLVSNSHLSPELVTAVFKSRYNLEKLESSCGDLNKLSVAGWESYESFEGETFTKLKHGYSKLVEHLRAQLPKDALRFNQVVEKIEYDLDNSVRVTAFNPKDNKRTTYEARYLLCTLPLGILKEQHEKIFSPRLPDEKIMAIENIGFGVLNKFFFIFDKPLDEKIGDLKIYWSEDLPFNLEANKKHNLKDNKFYKSFNDFMILPHCPNVLLGLVAGDEAVFTESLSDECLIDVVSEIWTKSFPNLHLPRPKKLIRSKWSSDKFSKGSYSYMSTSSRTEDVENLAEPLGKQIFFAGECTTYKYMGTVHGAYITGQDAAAKMIKAIKKSSSRPASKMSNRPSSSKSDRSNRPTSSSSRRD